MEIKQEFAPITIRIETEKELRDLQVIAKIAQENKYRGIGGFFHSPPKYHSEWQRLAERILDL
jgi:hypothetical protein